MSYDKHNKDPADNREDDGHGSGHEKKTAAAPTVSPEGCCHVANKAQPKDHKAYAHGSGHEHDLHGYGCPYHEHGDARRSAGAAYFCPMCSGVESDKPGSCPKCGMAVERNPAYREPARTLWTCPMHPQ